MDQITDELKKVLKAGMGAVATGMEKTQEAIETFAKKGEPLYQQAKTVVSDAADQLKQAVNDGMKAMNAKPKAEEIINSLKAFSQEEWTQIRSALDEFFAQAQQAAQEAQEAADELLHSDHPDGAADPEEVPADEEEEKEEEHSEE